MTAEVSINGVVLLDKAWLLVLLSNIKADL